MVKTLFYHQKSRHSLKFNRKGKSFERCPTLAELPPAPPGKKGWPWTKEIPQLLEFESNSPINSPRSNRYPSVSIITPSYNQGEFIEETIRSVLLQGYPNLEYIIIDGGSQDNTVDIIRKYEPWLAYWVSEPDHGQSHAINKGLAMSRGDIRAWINSDDIYFMDTISKVVREFHSTNDVHLVYGDGLYTDKNSNVIGVFNGKDTSLLEKLEYWKGWHILQPTVFFTRELYFKIGEIDQSFHYALDYDYFLRAAFHFRFKYIPGPVAAYRLHDSSKTGDWQSQKVFFHNECKQSVARCIKTDTILYWKWKLSYALRRPFSFYYWCRRMGRKLLNTLSRNQMLSVTSKLLRQVKVK